MPKLTKRTVEALETKLKNYIVFDAELPGFGVRVMPTGRRFFLVQYRRHGRTRRIMIGQFGPLTTEVARQKAMTLLGQAKGGGDDPALTRDALRQSTNMEQLGARFLKEHVEVRCKPTTQREYKRSVELFLDPFFGKQRIRSITTADVAELHGSLAHIPYQANRTLGVLSKMMNLAEVWGLRDRHTNPCDEIERYPEHKRERFLSLKEIEALGRALDDSEDEYQYAVAAFRLLLLTGCRLSEIQTLRWEHVYLDEGELRLADSKTGAKVVHLGTVAIEILRHLPRIDKNPFVIAGTKSNTHLTDLQKPWRRIRKAAGLEQTRIHDLRHTFASGGLAVGEGLPMIGKLLGHTQVQTTARYAHLATDPLKAAVDKISDRLAAALISPS
ncbi:tyrosine-type recombinase/integrase [Azospirillum doebereinerae]